MQVNLTAAAASYMLLSRKLINIFEGVGKILERKQKLYKL